MCVCVFVYNCVPVSVSLWSVVSPIVVVCLCLCFVFCVSELCVSVCHLSKFRTLRILQEGDELSESRVAAPHYSCQLQRRVSLAADAVKSGPLGARTQDGCIHSCCCVVCNVICMSERFVCANTYVPQSVNCQVLSRVCVCVRVSECECVCVCVLCVRVCQHAPP